MKSKSACKPRVFTLEQANRSLPLVSAIVRDLTILARDVDERRERMTLLTAGRRARPAQADLYAEELDEVRFRLERDGERLRALEQELLDLGIIVRNAREGTVDFPGRLHGQEGCYSWKLGEAEVLYWRKTGTAWEERQRLPSGSCASSDPS